MAATPETGFLVLADLTGYTAYLSGSEIEHAPEIAGDLLETIVGRLEPPFRLVKFEGDAAFLVRRGRARRRVPAARRDRSRLPRLPASTAQQMSRRSTAPLNIRIIPSSDVAFRSTRRRPATTCARWRRGSTSRTNSGISSSAAVRPRIARACALASSIQPSVVTITLGVWSSAHQLGSGFAQTPSR